MRPADGLGPLYIRHACADCHETGVRGPGLVQKMSVVEADGPLVIVVSGGVVSVGATTVQLRLAGEASVLPAASVARTSNVCEPTATPL